MNNTEVIENKVSMTSELTIYRKGLRFPQILKYQSCLTWSEGVLSHMVASGSQLGGERVVVLDPTIEALRGCCGIGGVREISKGEGKFVIRLYGPVVVLLYHVSGGLKMLCFASDCLIRLRPPTWRWVPCVLCIVFALQRYAFFLIYAIVTMLKINQIQSNSITINHHQSLPILFFVSLHRQNDQKGWRRLAEHLDRWRHGAIVRSLKAPLNRDPLLSP